MSFDRRRHEFKLVDYSVLKVSVAQSLVNILRSAIVTSNTHPTALSTRVLSLAYRVAFNSCYRVQL